MNKLQEKLENLTIAQLQDSLKTLQPMSGEHVAIVWHYTCDELEARMGEDAFWEWADAALGFDSSVEEKEA